jgi:hypothetical protein
LTRGAAALYAKRTGRKKDRALEQIWVRLPKTLTRPTKAWREEVGVGATTA